jgi:hypothetical protein
MARRDRIDPEALRRPFERHRPRQTVERRLRRGLEPAPGFCFRERPFLVQPTAFSQRPLSRAFRPFIGLI